MTPYAKHLKRWMVCTQCELSTQRTKTVFYRGTEPVENAEILFVGEAPGNAEDLMGEPFVGPAGHLLDKILWLSGIIGDAAMREPVLVPYGITNLVACYPQEAKEARVNEPPKACIKSCEERLVELISIISPRKIIWVGKLAAKWGPLAVNRLKPNLSMLQAEIMHPAFILRATGPERPLLVKRAVATIRSVL